jgi:hypothetical protein
MKQEQIEKIIENLDKKGHHLVNKTINENSIVLEYGDCRFTLNFNRNPMSINAVLRLDYRVTFDQENVDFLNSITNYWSIYKHWIAFNFKPKNEKDLEDTLYDLLKTYN